MSLSAIALFENARFMNSAMLAHLVGMTVTWCCRQAPKRSLAARLEMALDVARGMAALEENDPPIVHRDLKPTNIFIDAG